MHKAAATVTSETQKYGIKVLYKRFTKISDSITPSVFSLDGLFFRGRSSEIGHTMGKPQLLIKANLYRSIYTTKGECLARQLPGHFFLD